MNPFEKQALADRAAYRKGAEMTEIPTPRTDTYPTRLVERSIDEALHPKGMSTHSGRVQLDCSHVMLILKRSRTLERDLAAMERRAMDYVAMNERQAVNFAKCQADLARAVELLHDVYALVNDYPRYFNAGDVNMAEYLARSRAFLTELEARNV